MIHAKHRHELTRLVVSLCGEQRPEDGLASPTEATGVIITCPKCKELLKSKAEAEEESERD